MDPQGYYPAPMFADVRPHDHFTFFVRSRTRDRWHFVDLRAFAWNGQCDCEDFRSRRQKAIAEGHIHTDRAQCWHIRRARDRAYYSLLPKVAKQLDQNHEHKTSSGREETVEAGAKDQTRAVDNDVPRPTTAARQEPQGTRPWRQEWEGY